MVLIFTKAYDEYINLRDEIDQFEIEKSFESIH